KDLARTEEISRTEEIARIQSASRQCVNLDARFSGSAEPTASTHEHAMPPSDEPLSKPPIRTRPVLSHEGPFNDEEGQRAVGETPTSEGPSQLNAGVRRRGLMIILGLLAVFIVGSMVIWFIRTMITRKLVVA